eukprot:8056748-Alexandrium_andersonii.AAC.1
MRVHARSQVRAKARVRARVCACASARALGRARAGAATCKRAQTRMDGIIKAAALKRSPSPEQMAAPPERAS